MDSKPVVLVADDQPHIGEALRLLLKTDGFAVEVVSSPADVLKSVAAQKFDALLMDLNYSRDTTSGKEGMDLLASLRRVDANLPVVVMTAWGNMQLAVEAMRRGARDFVMKPWDNAELLQTMRAQVSAGRNLRRNDSFRIASATAVEEFGVLTDWDHRRWRRNRVDVRAEHDASFAGERKNVEPVASHSLTFHSVA